MKSVWLKRMEHTTKSGALIQHEVLRQILEKNADTEYFKRHGLDKEVFSVNGFKKLPLVEYDDIEADIKRIADGDTRKILCSDPVTKFFISSGTTNGRSKLIPMTKESVDQVHKEVFMIDHTQIYLAFWFSSHHSITKGGFKAETVTTSGLNSNEFKQAASAFVSPYEVFQATNNYQCMYCHLLCGLLRRKEVTVVTSAFSFAITEAFRMLDEVWPELLKDIDSGSLSPKITDPRLRLAMSGIARPDPELAAQLRRLFSSRPSGIIERLWPKAKFLITVTTGAMVPYVPRLRALAGNTPLVCGNYFSSECLIGINLSGPALSPEDAVFTVNPEFGYFEFLWYSDSRKGVGNIRHIVGLTEVKAGEKYEIVVTTRAGLYRYKLGDVVQVTGFFNSCPTLRFLFRKKVVLSIATDKTDELELQTVVNKASLLLKKRHLQDFAACVDFSSFPGHYVIFWELNNGSCIDAETLQDCCEQLDVSFNDPYLRGRSSGAIAALELCVVKGGSFREIFEHHVARGGSGSQYKTRRCVSNGEATLDLLRRNTLQQTWSSKFAN